VNLCFLGIIFSKEVFMMAKRISFFLGVLFLPLLIFSWGVAHGQGITPSMEQEFSDAKSAIEAAQKAEAEKYAPEPLKQGQDLLTTAENARQAKDVVKFTQASRLARAYADLARAVSELKSETEKLVTVQDELQRAKAEIERLKKVQ
jgi:hypothetical protein